MAALDTNVLVRLIAEDDPMQVASAKKLLAKCILENETLFIPITVSLELEWVLRSSFGFSKPLVIQALSRLLTAVELSFESESALEIALVNYEQGSADYSDYLHLALAGNVGAHPLWTFDKAASKATGAQLLS